MLNYFLIRLIHIADVYHSSTSPEKIVDGENFVLNHQPCEDCYSGRGLDLPNLTNAGSDMWCCNYEIINRLGGEIPS
jgi:hypothetical protein